MRSSIKSDNLDYCGILREVDTHRTNAKSQTSVLFSSRRLLQQMCAFLLGRYHQSPALMVWHLVGAEQASVLLHCVDPSCTRTVLYSIPAAVPVSLLHKNNRFYGAIFNWI